MAAFLQCQLAMEAREAMGQSGALPCDSVLAMWTSFEKFALLNMGRRKR